MKFFLKIPKLTATKPPELEKKKRTQYFKSESSWKRMKSGEKYKDKNVTYDVYNLYRFLDASMTNLLKVLEYFEESHKEDWK